MIFLNNLNNCNNGTVNQLLQELWDKYFFTPEAQPPTGGMDTRPAPTEKITRVEHLTSEESRIYKYGLRNRFEDIQNVIRYSYLKNDVLAQQRIWICWLISSDQITASDWLRVTILPFEDHVLLALLNRRCLVANELFKQHEQSGDELTLSQISVLYDSFKKFGSDKRYENYITVTWARLAKMMATNTYTQQIRAISNNELGQNTLRSLYYILKWEKIQCDVIYKQINHHVHQLREAGTQLCIDAANKNDIESLFTIYKKCPQIIENAIVEILFSLLVSGHLDSAKDLTIKLKYRNSPLYSMKFVDTQDFLKRFSELHCETGLVWHQWLLNEYSSLKDTQIFITERLMEIRTQKKSEMSFSWVVEENFEDFHTSPLKRICKVRLNPSLTNANDDMQTDQVNTPKPRQ